VTQVIGSVHVTQVTGSVHMTQVIDSVHVTQVIGSVHVTQVIGSVHVTQTSYMYRAYPQHENKYTNRSLLHHHGLCCTNKVQNFTFC